MATDIATIIRNIESFHDLEGKTVIHVGAGGGQFIAYAARTSGVLAVDSDPEAVQRLRSAVRAQALEERIEVVEADFLALHRRADLVFFEFCLHEIADPAAALSHALTLAPQTLVADPAPESRWAWYCGEEDKARRSWAAVERSRVLKSASFQGVQRFHDYAELHAKIGTQGEPTLSRIEEFRDRLDFTIEMPYRMALLAAR